MCWFGHANDLRAPATPLVSSRFNTVLPIIDFLRTELEVCDDIGESEARTGFLDCLSLAVLAALLLFRPATAMALPTFA